MNRFSQTAILALSVCLLGGFSAQAGENNVLVDRVSVFYGDLDLSREAGAEVLFTRIRHAADEACGGKPDNRDIAALESYRTCTKTTMDSAITRLGNARVAALHGQAIERTASSN